MKVISRGVPEATKRYRVTCGSCKSVIEYSYKEIHKISDCQREGTTHYLGECPVCSNALYDYAPKALQVHDGRGPG